MAQTIEQLESTLFLENDGNKFNRLKDRLIKNFSETDREKVIGILIKYCKEGQLLYWREFLLSDIIRLVQDEETPYISFFEWAITNPELMYWGIDGLIKTKGKKSYDELINLASNEEVELQNRAKAIKHIAIESKQPFDRDLPEDPGYWKVHDLRLDELINWKNNGYESGIGYEVPVTHPSLDNPKTEFEKIVAKLNKKLKANRRDQDLSDPSDWLNIADKNQITEIENKWKLPDTYLLFLKQYSPLKVFINSKEKYHSIHLYGTDNLIKNQEGYSFNPISKEIIKDWPTNFVVIADSGADPYCIDINDPHGPVYYSMHGTGTWEFEKYSDSFEEFLKEIIK